MTIAVGTGYTKAGMPLSQKDVDIALGRFADKLSAIAGGYTMHNALGGYTHDDGHGVTEKSRVFTVTVWDGNKVLDVRRACEKVRDALQQESVYFDLVELKEAMFI